MDTLDFSKWDEHLFNYAKALITYKDILQFDNNDIVSFSADYRQKQTEFLSNVVEAHLYWIGFGVGIENLIKAVLIKHQVLPLKRRADFDNKIPVMPTQFATYQDQQTYRQNNTLDKYQKVYKHVKDVTIKADSNPWLALQFQNAGINHPLEINTSTLHKLYTQEIPKLESKGKITTQEKDELEKSLEVFKLIRRNVDSHIFLQSRIIGSINGDMEYVYIPTINLLTNIYKRT